LEKNIVKYQPGEIIKQADNYLGHLNYLTPEKTDPFLIPYRKGDKWGFCTEDKKIVIDCVYDDVRLFEEGLAQVELKKKWGYIDKTGEIKISLIFAFAESFTNGIAKVHLDGKAGLIDKRGSIITSCQFDIICDFSEGLAGVLKNGVFSYINMNGEIVLPLIYSNVGDFKGGIASVQIQNNWLSINKKGEILGECNGWEEVPERIVKVYVFDKLGFRIEEKHLSFELMDKEKDKFYEKKGVPWLQEEWIWVCGDSITEYVFAFQYEHPSYYQQGLASVSLNGKVGFINKEGVLVIKNKYFLAESFNDGIALVKINKGLKGYINKVGIEYWED